MTSSRSFCWRGLPLFHSWPITTLIIFPQITRMQFCMVVKPKHVQGFCVIKTHISITDSCMPRCFGENKHSVPFCWRNQIYLGRQLFNWRQLYHFCHENLQHGSKRIQVAAFSACLFLVYVSESQCLTVWRGERPTGGRGGPRVWSV